MPIKEDILPQSGSTESVNDPTEHQDVEVNLNFPAPEKPKFTSQMWLLTPFLLLQVTAGITGGFTTILVHNFDNIIVSGPINSSLNVSVNYTTNDIVNSAIHETVNSCSKTGSPIILGQCK